MKSITTLLAFFVLSLMTLMGQNNDLRFHYLSMENGLPRNTVYSISEDKYGFIWMATIDGVCKFDGYNVTPYQIPNSTRTGNIIPKKIVCDKSGNIWTYYSGRKLFFKYNFTTDSFEYISLFNVPLSVRTILPQNNFKPESVENNDFKCTLNNQTFEVIDKKNQTSTSYSLNLHKTFGLKDEMILSLFIDSNNTLWVGSDAGGVCYAYLNQLEIRHRFNVGVSAQSYMENTIRGIAQSPNGDLWLGIRKSGLAKIDAKNDNITYFSHSEINPGTISNNYIRKIFFNKIGELWIGTKDGINLYLPSKLQFKKFPFESKNTDNWVYAIEQNDKGDLWIGTWQDGILRFDRQSDSFIPYKSKDSNYTWNIRSLCKDNGENMWIGTDGFGLTYFQKENTAGREKYNFINFQHNVQNSFSISDNRVYSLCRDQSGILWIGTAKGLDRFDAKTKRFIHVMNKRFISATTIFGILNDEFGNLWLSHQYGITRYNPQTNTSNDYTTKEDLYNNELSENACYRNPKTGECFFGGNLGLISFIPNNKSDKSSPPRVYLTQLKVSGKSIVVNQPSDNHVILAKPLYLTDKINLKWSERNIELGFAALHYANPANNNYAYRLLGFNDEWQNSDASNRKAIYTNLSPGTYIFEVKASNAMGVWSENAAKLTITILNPWWKTWWAFTIYSLIIIGLIWFVFKNLKDRYEWKKNKELNQSKMRFFTQISHEFRTPLTLIIDPLEKLITENPDKRTIRELYILMQRNANQLLGLINQLLDFRKLESGHLILDRQETDIIPLIYNAVASFEVLARKQKIRFSIQTEVDHLISFIDPDKIIMILNNLLSNAFKFTPEQGEIKLTLELESNKDQYTGIWIKITDSGKGIASGEKDKIFELFYQADNQTKYTVGSGVGLALTKELVELHGGKIVFDSEVGKGSSFSFFIPLTKTYVIQDLKSVQNIINDTDEKSDDNRDKTLINQDKLPVMLVVDDNDEIRNYIEYSFKNNFRILKAENGVEALKFAQESIPEIIVSDVMMPDMDGIELCKLIKSNELTCHIPVVLLTARRSDEFRTIGYETGADAYITKPFNSKVLEARIKNLMDQRSKLRELYSMGVTSELRKIAVNKTDEVFLSKVVDHINKYIDNPEFDTEFLAALLNMSRWQLLKKIKALTDSTILDLITTARMKKAAEYLIGSEFTIAEVAYKVGYTSPSNFTRAFNKFYGVNPTNYIDNLDK